MNLPKVVFGTSSLGNLFVALPDAVKCAIVEAYIKAVHGVAFFDTAGKYGAGLALESLGICLRQLNVDKEDVLISNKLGWVRTPLTTPEPTFEPGVWKGLQYDAIQKISYDGILECYEQGNELLGGYSVKHVSVHDPDEYLAAASSSSDQDKRYVDILGAYAALNDLKLSGKVDTIGVGAKNWRSIERIDKDIKLDWVMIANSMTVHSHPKELLEFMRKLERQGTRIINSAVFNAGFLTGGSFYNYREIDPDSSSGRELFQWRNQFYEICEAFSLSPVAVGIKFGMAAPGVISIALSTTNPERISENMAFAEATIPDGFWQQLHQESLITTEGLEMVMNK